jgi:hypothetical protein
MPGKQWEPMSTLYLAAAVLLMLVACIGAGKKAHRHIFQPRRLAALVVISLIILLLIWLLLIALTRKEAESPRALPDYSTPSGTG